MRERWRSVRSGYRVRAFAGDRGNVPCREARGRSGDPEHIRHPKRTWAEVPPASARWGDEPAIGAVAAAVLLVLVAVLVPLRFARAVRRSLRDPEFWGLFVLVVVTLAAGTLFYWKIEGWTLLDSFYFSSITLTTVGYGDPAPATNAGKLFTVFYVFTGIGLIVAFVNAVARAAVQQRAERRSLAGRRDQNPEDR